MSQLIQVAKKMSKAWEEKDEVAFRSCIHADYSFTGPMMKMNSAEEAVGFMKECNFQCTTENCEVVVEGEKLVHVFDWNVTSPFQATIPMVEVMDFEGAKVKCARLYFDSALFPAEVKEKMMTEAVV